MLFKGLLHPQVRWVLDRQLLLTAVLAVGAWVAAGGHAGLSAFLGGAIGWVANLAYLWRAMGQGSDTEAAGAFRAQVAGEAAKFSVTLLLFALVFLAYRDVAALPLFLGYGSTFIVHWMALLKIRN